MSKSSVKAWMPFYPGDYLASTGHLTTEEHGAYLLLILHYWATQKPLPIDDAKLARIAKLSLSTWMEMRQTLADFFVVNDVEWLHERINQEIEKAVNVSRKRKKAGAMGGKTSAENRKSLESEHAIAKANATAGAEQELQLGSRPSQSPSQSQLHPQHPKPTKPGEDGTVVEISSVGGGA